MNKIENFLDKLTPYSTQVVRIGLGLVFVYFGYTGIFTPQMWTGFVPSWTSFIASAKILVQLHGIFEMLFGMFLIIKFQTRIVASLLLLNLLHIVTTLSFGPVMIRDLGLCTALFYIATAKRDQNSAQM